MANLLRKVVIPRLLLVTAFVVLSIAVVAQGTLLSRQARRLSALEDQVRSLQRLNALEDQVRGLQHQNLRMADAIFGSRGRARSLGEVARDVDAVRRDMAEAREASRRTR
jgi:hypothetical protein